MHRIFSVLFGICLLAHVASAEIEVNIEKQPDWKKPILDKAKFTAELKENKELLGNTADDGDGFVVFSCTAEENLSKRILWINAEVTFSNGFTRKFENISFMILEKGTEYDIKKVPFDRSLNADLFSSENEKKEELAITKLHITSIALK